MATTFLPGQARSHQEGAVETTRSWVHQRDLPSRMAGQCCTRPEEKQRVEDVHVDYTNLNKHCPKDPFGLPRIDQVIDSTAATAGCVLLSFLDCYSGYHQIALKEEDQIKTTFITPYGAYVSVYRQACSGIPLVVGFVGWDRLL